MCIYPPIKILYQYVHEDKSITTVIPHAQTLIFMYLFFIQPAQLTLGELFNEDYQDLRLGLSNYISLVENTISFPWSLTNKEKLRSFSFIEKKKTIDSGKLIVIFKCLKQNTEINEYVFSNICKYIDLPNIFFPN